MNSTTLQPRLVVVSGADGTGKTSLVEGLARKLRARGQHVAVASLWDLYGAPELPRMFTSREEAQRYVCGISARSRLHFFTHCLFGALDRALAARPEVLLFDAYWYKYFAGEVALGTPLHEVLEVASGLPVPEVILELDAPVEVTVQRKRQFGAYESGGSLNAFGFVLSNGLAPHVAYGGAGAAVCAHRTRRDAAPVNLGAPGAAGTVDRTPCARLNVRIFARGRACELRPSSRTGSLRPRPTRHR